MMNSSAFMRILAELEDVRRMMSDSDNNISNVEYGKDSNGYWIRFLLDGRRMKFWVDSENMCEVFKSKLKVNDKKALSYLRSVAFRREENG